MSDYEALANFSGVESEHVNAVLGLETHKRGEIRKGDPAETDKKMACMTATGKQPNLSHDLSPSTQSLTVSVFVVTGVESTKSPFSRIPQREVKGVSFIQAETHCLRFFILYA